MLRPEDVAAFARRVVGDDDRELFVVVYLDGRPSSPPAHPTAGGRAGRCVPGATVRHAWLRFRLRLSREWTEIPPDERPILFGSLAASVGIPLLVALVDPLATLVRLSFWLGVFLGFPAWVIGRAIYQWSQSDDYLPRAFVEDLRPGVPGPLAFGTVPLPQFPLATILLILANVAIHYSGIDPVDYAMRMADPSLWLWTSVTSLFMHANGSHLWGNMLFLWMFGSAVEPRLSRTRYLAYYLLAGSAGHALSIAFFWLAGADLVISLGASGAISGVMGLFVVRCYFARIDASIPILGALGAILPIGFRLHVNAMVLVGLFFFFDLSGARSQLEGEWTHINHWSHIGGYVLGLCVAYATGLLREGRKEALEIRASLTADLENPGPDAEVRDRVLELDPDHVPLRIARARARSKYDRRESGRQDYEVAIRLLLKRDPDEAARIFAECFRKYWTPLSPREQLALTPALERLGEREIGARALERVAESSGIEAGERNQALLHQARLLLAMDLEDAAAHVYQRLLRANPEAPLREIAEAKLRGLSVRLSVRSA